MEYIFVAIKCMVGPGKMSEEEHEGAAFSYNIRNLEHIQYHNVVIKCMGTDQMSEEENEGAAIISTIRNLMEHIYYLNVAIQYMGTMQVSEEENELVILSTFRNIMEHIHHLDVAIQCMDTGQMSEEENEGAAIISIMRIMGHIHYPNVAIQCMDTGQMSAEENEAAAIISIMRKMGHIHHPNVAIQCMDTGQMSEEENGGAAIISTIRNIRGMKEIGRPGESRGTIIDCKGESCSSNLVRESDVGGAEHTIWRHLSNKGREKTPGGRYHEAADSPVTDSCTTIQTFLSSWKDLLNTAASGSLLLLLPLLLLYKHLVPRVWGSSRGGWKHAGDRFVCSESTRYLI